MADWLTDNWRDILSIAGLVVSVSGFSIAIWQIVRSRKAAEAAEIAVLATKESIAKNLTISDLVRASERIQEIRNLQRQGQWERALDRYYNLRIILFDISAQQPDLTFEQRSIIESAIQYLQSLEEAVGTAITEGRDPVDIEIGVEGLQSAQLLFDGLASQLKQSI